MSNDRCRFGEYTLDSARASLQRGDVPVALRPKSFALLEYLVRHAGRLVSKDELLAAVWAGVVVTEDSLTRCISELRAALRDDGQQLIKTVSRRGYLFDATVTVPGAADAAALSALTPPPIALPSQPAWRRGRVGWGLTLLALLGLLAAAGWMLARQQRPAAPRLSLVVMPFAARGIEPGQAWLADALTEDLTAALARLRGLAVISAASALSFKGQPVDARQAGAELGVRYALEGSVVRGDDLLRINARLVDAQTGASLWSDQFEVNRAERLQVLDDIVLRLSSALDVELVRDHSQRVARRDAAALDAEDLAMQCTAAAREQGGESGAPSYALCEEALLKDPRNLRALARLALSYGDRVSRGQTLDPVGDLQRAAGYAARALEVDAQDPAAQCALAVVLEGQHRVPEAVVAAQRCQALNPSSVDANRILAIEYFFLAQPEQTLSQVERGMRLSPRDPRMATFLLFKGWALLQMGRDAEAVAWLRQAQAVQPGSPNIHLALAAALALGGHDAEARTTMAAYLALRRTRARTIEQFDHRPDGNPAFAKFALRVNEGLRRAGMPER